MALSAVDGRAGLPSKWLHLGEEGTLGIPEVSVLSQEL